MTESLRLFGDRDPSNIARPRARPEWLAPALRLTLLTMVGWLLMLPYERYLIAQAWGARESDAATGRPILLFLLIAGVAYFFIRISLGAAKQLQPGWLPIGMWAPDVDTSKGRRDATVTAALLGAAVGLAIGVAGPLLVDQLPMRAIQSPPIWVATLGSLGAGILEEIVCRLGIMTLAAWLIARVTMSRAPASAVIWIANVVAALFFGAQHLPQAAAFAPLTPSWVAFVLGGNGAVGIACGWLYWRRGIAAAMIAHASVDLVMKVALPLMMLNG